MVLKTCSNLCKRVGEKRGLRLILNLGFVRDDNPVSWCLGSKCESCFKAGLFEAWEHVVAEIGFKLSVEVLLAILPIDERV